MFTLVAFVTGCASTSPTNATVPSIEERPAMTERWESPLLRNHPLVGRIWHVRQERSINVDDLVTEVVAARFVLLGEKHDNSDHHRLQNRLLEAMIEAGRRPTVALEMIDIDRQDAIDGIIEAGGCADALGAAVEWERRWGHWELYRPLIASAIEHDLRIVAANFPLGRIRGLVRGGLETLDAEAVARLGLDQPIAQFVQEAMRTEMMDAHCGHMPPAMADGMGLAQRARDGQMAERLDAAAGDDGAVLIAGAGHTRNDRGVAHLLRRRRPNDGILSVAFIEVADGRFDPRDYAAGYGSDALPFDFVWFTPRDNDDDPYEAFRSRAE